MSSARVHRPVRRRAHRAPARALRGRSRRHRRRVHAALQSVPRCPRLRASAARSADLARRALRGGRLFVGDASDSMSAAQATFALVFADDLDAASEAATSGEAFAQQTGRTFGVRRLHAHARARRVARRRPARRRRRGWPRAPSSSRAGRTRRWRFGSLLVVRTERGDLEGAQRALDGARLPDPLPDVTTYPPRAARPRDAAGRARRGRGGARGPARVRAARGRSSDQPDDPVALAGRAAPPAPRGPPRAAAALAAEELALARRWGAPSAIGIALRATGAARPR